MADSSRPPEQRCAPLAIANLPKEILLEILLLLPPKSILRCRAVCKAWRAVTKDRAFLLAHHRRQPPRRLFTFVRDVGGNNHDLGILDYCVEAINFRTHEFLSVVRFTGEDYDFSLGDSQFVVHAACSGLLLMSYNKCLHLCNPTTRQWLYVFPPALQHDKVVGLYAHGNSSEYRVLYYRAMGDLAPKFYISTVGSGKEKCIWPHSPSASLIVWLAKGSEGTAFNEPFLFHGNLHWLPHLGRHDKIVMFDTVNEVFQWLQLPFKMCNVVSLLEIDCDEDVRVAEIWLLQDHKNQMWACKYHIELPALDISTLPDLDREVSLGWKPSQDYSSLVRHAFFETQDNVNYVKMNHHLSSGGWKTVHSGSQISLVGHSW
ncbi:putative F-box protein At3g49980 [Setaria italica]|uniref:putative F-box protein At3g49980 n=1 Tax=Setaria italica TaxID=4555 RepID=UPI000350A72E|nr:putative F-box protein At3g49980 [Setaria italica]